MADLTRRSVLRASAASAAAGILGRPYLANAAAKAFNRVEEIFAKYPILQT